MNELINVPTWQLLGLLEANHKLVIENNDRQAMVDVEEINSEIVRRAGE